MALAGDGAAPFQAPLLRQDCVEIGRDGGRLPPPRVYIPKTHNLIKRVRDDDSFFQVFSLRQGHATHVQSPVPRIKTLSNHFPLNQIAEVTQLLIAAPELGAHGSAP